MSLGFSSGLLPTVGVVGMHMRTQFSLHHIKNAAYFCRQLSDEKRSRIANATGALFSATAYVEATVNELFSKTDEKPDKHLGDILEASLAEIAARINEIKMEPTLRKFKFFVEEAGFGPLDLGKNPSQDIRRMFEIRDGLVHYKAYWLDASSDNMVKDQRTLARTDLGRFLKDKFCSGEGFGFDTDKWLNREFAGWCVHSSMEFIDHVFSLFNGIPFHNHIKNELKTRSCDL